MASSRESTAALNGAGFTQVQIQDRHAWYQTLAEQELASIAGPLYPLMVARLGREKAEHFVANWRQLVLVVQRGELRPTHLKAVKPW